MSVALEKAGVADLMTRGAEVHLILAEGVALGWRGVEVQGHLALAVVVAQTRLAWTVGVGVLHPQEVGAALHPLQQSQMGHGLPEGQMEATCPALAAALGQLQTGCWAGFEMIAWPSSCQPIAALLGSHGAPPCCLSCMHTTL